jgi:hypothetical protein
MWYKRRMSWKLPVVAVSLVASLLLIVGAGSAQAFNTTICTTSFFPSQTCTGGFQRPSGTVYKAVASGTNAVQTSSGESLSCTASTIEFETLHQVGSPLLEAKVTNFTIGGCTDVTNGTSCFDPSLGVQPFTMQIEWAGADHGVLKVTHTPTNPTLVYVCNSGAIICSFETPVIKFETAASSPAIASMSAVMEQNGGGAYCGGVSKLLGKYVFTAPASGSFIVEHE